MFNTTSRARVGNTVYNSLLYTSVGDFVLRRFIGIRISNLVLLKTPVSKLNNLVLSMSKRVLYSFLCFVILNFGVSVLSEILRPRGVAISKANLYTSNNDNFVCFDGRKTIKFNQVNDDYCDCVDGSDEPGTSACPNTFFHCTNAGYKPKNIPSSRVNDGICDCCDASDEYATDAQCVNNCSEMGKEDRQREKQRLELAKMGSHMRADMSNKGKTMKAEHKVRLAELEKSKNEAEALMAEREKIKQQIEELENSALQVYRDAEEATRHAAEQQATEENRHDATEHFIKYDSNSNGLLEVVELQTRIFFDRDHDGVVSEEEAKYYLDERDSINLEDFITSSWPRIKPILMLDSGLFKPPTDEPSHVEDDGASKLEESDENHPDDFHPDDENEEHNEGDEEEETGEGDVSTNSSLKPFYSY